MEDNIGHFIRLCGSGGVVLVGRPGHSPGVIPHITLASSAVLHVRPVHGDPLLPGRAQESGPDQHHPQQNQRSLV